MMLAEGTAMQEEPRRKGRPRSDRPRKVMASVMLDPDVLAWASQRPEGISATVRNCLEKMMKSEREQQ